MIMSILKVLLLIIAISLSGYYYNDYYFSKSKIEERYRCSNDSNETCAMHEKCCEGEVGWRCCYGRDAVCCGDKKSCCGNGEVCDLTNQYCLRRPEGHPEDKTDL